APPVRPPAADPWRTSFRRGYPGPLAGPGGQQHPDLAVRQEQSHALAFLVAAAHSLVRPARAAPVALAVPHARRRCARPRRRARAGARGAGRRLALPALRPARRLRLLLLCRPPLPPGSTWAGGGSGDPVAYEDDAFSDDFLGRTSGSGDPACVEVCNHSGDLYCYPLGEKLNGPGELGTPEIFVRWTATYTSTLTSPALSSSGHGIGSSSATCFSMTSTVRRVEWVRSGSAEVYPC
ncbi:MAG: hypothetical protein NTV21_10545, partial [Planctomycetota bacterium]|nr:hypothetical protein [Planctomycetota bacterium]